MEYRMSRLVVDQLQGRTSASNTITIPTGHKINAVDAGAIFAPGSIIQMQNTILTTELSQSMTVNVQLDIDGLAVDITPKFSNSKIYLTARWFGEYGNNGPWNSMWNLKRNGTLIGPSAANNYGIHAPALTYQYDNYGSTPETMYMDWVDSPGTTSTITYQVCVITTSTTQTFYTNRCVSASSEIGSSSITVFEIAQ
jgi:hypothetical protein